MFRKLTVTVRRGGPQNSERERVRKRQRERERESRSQLFVPPTSARVPADLSFVRSDIRLRHWGKEGATRLKGLFPSRRIWSPLYAGDGLVDHMLHFHARKMQHLWDAYGACRLWMRKEKKNVRIWASVAAGQFSSAATDASICSQSLRCPQRGGCGRHHLKWKNK